MIKRVIFIPLVSIILISMISAINIEVSSEPIQNSVILDLNEPAVFNFSIKNNGPDDVFEIYSLVGIDIKPETSFEVKNQETKYLKIQVIPQDALKKERDTPLNFEFKIKNSEKEIKTGSLSINIIKSDSILEIQSSEIDPRSEKIIITIKNKLNKEFNGISIKFISAFFEEENKLSIGPKEIKKIEIALKKDDLQTLSSGKYIMSSEIDFLKTKTKINSQIDYLEHPDIVTEESKNGFIIKNTEITKKNLGNTRKTVDIKLNKNLISSFFTSANIPPKETKINRFQKEYHWEKELLPNERLDVILKTNFYYPIILIILIIIIIILIKKYLYSSVILRKKVSFVKTRGGQFALKVSLILKARKYVERIKIIDRLPHLVELYDKFGSIPPNHIDINNRRLEWNLVALNKDESRIFTYIIYSKIGVVGRFELPNAMVTYERDGKIKETFSNRSFYINEPSTE